MPTRRIFLGVLKGSLRETLRTSLLTNGNTIQITRIYRHEGGIQPRYVRRWRGRPICCNNQSHSRPWSCHSSPHLACSLPSRFFAILGTGGSAEVALGSGNNVVRHRVIRGDGKADVRESGDDDAEDVCTENAEKKGPSTSQLPRSVRAVHTTFHRAALVVPVGSPLVRSSEFRDGSSFSSKASTQPSCAFAKSTEGPRPLVRLTRR